jgi:signal transduction histidine kinase
MRAIGFSLPRLRLRLLRPRWSRPPFRRPRWTVRLRLTLLYGLLFFVAGAGLLGITNGLVRQSVNDPATSSFVLRAGPPPRGLAADEQKLLSGIFYAGTGPVAAPLPGADLGPPPVVKQGAGNQGAALRQIRVFTGQVSAAAQKEADNLRRQAQAKINQARSATLNALLTKSGFALAIMTLISIGLGWLMAGRALRPVRTMSIRARGISERNLHERLALAGPNDELKELGDTFDGLLARLETAFESQRRFVANASHELRTPITVERTLVEVALADPEADAESLRATCRRVLAASEQQERLIEALLTLARSQRGLEERSQIDLADIADDVVQRTPSNGVRLEAALASARTSGDPALLERLMTNLIDNALHYNTERGWARATTGVRRGRPMLRVENTGSVIPAGAVEALLEPFRRGDADRTGHPDGLGLGLSIVHAIAVAHGAELHAEARSGGGLAVEVQFPLAQSPSSPG